MKPIRPMEPKSGQVIPEGKEWIAQIKWDGVRALTYYDGQEVRLYNRKLNERTTHYPEITNITSYCKAQSVILDGEVIALSADGKPSFHEVMKRDGIRRTDKIAQIQKTTPIFYMVFDVLFFNGEWVHTFPLRDRIQILTEIITPNAQVQLVSSHEQGKALFEVMKEHSMEGIVMKNLNSPYVIGEKRDHWIKIKHFQDIIAVIGGYTLSGGVVNSVLLGLYNEQDHFIYIGHTGTGKLSHQEWRMLTEVLSSLTRPHRPFANQPERQAEAFWVEPLITVKIQYAEWTEGRSLRQPSIQAFVEEQPKDCRLKEEMLRK